MRSWLVIALLAAACGGSASGPKTKPRDVEVLLNPQLASASNLGALVSDFDISPDRLVVVADAEHLYLVGWGGVKAVEGLGGAESFAYTPDGLLLVVRGTQLLYLADSGTLETFFELPHAGMGLAAGTTDTVYLFDRTSDDGTYALYQLQPGRELAKLLAAPRPIDSVAHTADRLLFVSDGTVFEATAGKPMRMIVRLEGSTIRSVAAEGNRVYASDGAAVYAIADDGIVMVSATAGGTLRVRDGALFVLDPARPLLLRLPPR